MFIHFKSAFRTNWDRVAQTEPKMQILTIFPNKKEAIPERKQ